MANTKYKQMKVHDKRVPYSTSPFNLAPDKVMKGHWNKQALQSGDTFPPAGGRKVFSYGLNGATRMQTPVSGSTYDGTLEQLAPKPDEWRTICFGNFNVTPGHWLRARGLFLPSGPTQNGPNGGGAIWNFSGSQGAVRAQLNFSNEGIQLTQQVVSFDVPGSNHVSGNLPDGFGKSWPLIRHDKIADVYPLEVANAISNVATFSEMNRCEVTLQYRGGVRVLDFELLEYPVEYGFEHTSGSLLSGAVDLSYPVYDVNGQVPQKIVTEYPSEKAQDGANWTEPRFGSHLALDVLKNQVERLGPMIMNWTVASERNFGPGDTNVESLIISSTTPQNILDVTGSNAWHVTGSGWAVPSQNQMNHNTNDPFMIKRGRAATIRCVGRIKANTGNGGADLGTVRFQSSARSWHEVQVQQNLASWVPFDFYLEGARAGDDETGNLQVFAWSSDGAGGSGQLNIQAIQVNHGSGITRKEEQ